MKNKNMMMLVALVLIVLAGAGGFFGGMTYQKNQASSLGIAGANGARSGNYAARFGQNGQSAANFRPVRGQVLDMNNNSLTVKLSSGSTQIVVLSASTAFMQSTKAALSDVKTGDTVNVVGTANSDGSVTAQQIQINPPTGGLVRPTGTTPQAPAR